MFGDSEKGDMLDIWVMFGMICDEVVDIVILSVSCGTLKGNPGTYVTPPAETETADEVGDCHADHPVPPPVARHAGMSSIMREDCRQNPAFWDRSGLTSQLVPEETEKEG